MANNISPLHVLREQLPRFWAEPQAADMREFLSRQTPIAAARGIASGILGAPGDIESLIRMLPGLSEKTILPTSGDIEKRLPGSPYSESPMARAVTTGGQLAGGFYTGPGSPLKAIASLPAAVRHGAGEFVRASAIPTTRVVKPKGGNWLPGSVERLVGELRLPTGSDTSSAAARKEAINSWIEGPLTRYIKTYAGTPEDPVRLGIDRRASDAQKAYDIAAKKAQQQLARAERIRAEGPRPDMPREIWEGAVDRARFQGETILEEADRTLLAANENLAHVPTREFARAYAPEFVPYMLRQKRTAAGYPESGMAQFPAAMGWERASDEMITRTPVSELLGTETVAENPWLANLPPETELFSIRPHAAGSDTGIADMLETLQSAMNPRARLPGHLRFKPEDLAGYSMEKAVQRAADINAYKAEQKALKDAEKARELARSPAVQVFKEYPENNPRGLQWVEIRKPEDGKGARKALEEQLQSEGRLMDNCVGGYCSKVEGGRTKIYSLRDAKGQPHVTVEVATPEDFRDTLAAADLPADVREDLASRGLLDPSLRWAYSEWRGNYVPVRGQWEPKIVQIKGKQNKAPAAQYLPYVQDFVKSGKWDEVGDLRNTGLLEFTPRRQDIPGGIVGGIPRFQESGIESGYYKEDELRDLIRGWQERTGNAPRSGYATGGLVKGLDLGYNEALVDEMVEQLRSEYGV